MNEPFKTTERFVIQRRWATAKSYEARHWHNFEYRPDGRVNMLKDATFKTLDDAKKALAKLIQRAGTPAEYRIINEVRTYTLIED
jgi:hypothetical protein